MFPRNTKILVVDDMKTIRMVIKKSLLQLGYEDVTEFDDGDVAWSALEASIPAQKPFQLVISDWTMARMTGLELLKKVRAHKTMGNLPFLMITAESDIAQVKEAIQAGVSGYITKPFTLDTIKQKIQAVWTKLHP